MRTLTLPLLLSLGSLVACGDDGTSASTDAAVSIDAPVAARTITVTGPATVTRGTPLALTFTFTGMQLADPTRTAPMDGFGHYHAYVDGATMYNAGWTPTLMVPTAAAAVGPHQIRFVLADGRHVEFTPKAEFTFMYTVQ
jgi:hypothetical protein